MIPKDTEIKIRPLYAIAKEWPDAVRRTPITEILNYPYAIISIMTHGIQKAELARNEHCQGILRVNFPDFVKPMENWEETELFNPGIATEIWSFLEGLPPIQALVIHCEAGVSRSPAVGAAIAKVLGQDHEDYFQKYHPNPLVYRVMLET